jgi:L-alanine-DL-glutamate epimerase-like enolase superfamily enzyme
MREGPYLEYNATANPLRTDLLAEPIRPVQGIVTVPEKPGLGIALREDTLSRFRWQP